MGTTEFLRFAVNAARQDIDSGVIFNFPHEFRIVYNEARERKCLSYIPAHTLFFPAGHFCPLGFINDVSPITKYTRKRGC